MLVNEWNKRFNNKLMLTTLFKFLFFEIMNLFNFCSCQVTRNSSSLFVTSILVTPSTFTPYKTILANLKD